MNDYWIEKLKIIATYAELIPIIISLVKYGAGKRYRLFLIFSIYGFITDMLVWRLYKYSELLSFRLFVAYTLIEAVFYIYFITRLSNLNSLKRSRWWLMSFILALWFYAYKPSIHTFDLNMLSSKFDTTYSIIISILSVAGILKITEDDKNIFSNPDTWFLMGTFLYFFSTFFLTTFNESALLAKIWWIHSVLNIATAFFYSKVFLKTKRNE